MDGMRWDTHEPKFSNNAGTAALRPGVRVDGVRNLYMCGAWTRSCVNNHSMEGAVETGNKAAAAVLQDLFPGCGPTSVLLRNTAPATVATPSPPAPRSDRSIDPVCVYEKPRYLVAPLTAPVIALDRALYRRGLPDAPTLVTGGSYVAFYALCILALVLGALVLLLAVGVFARAVWRARTRPPPLPAASTTTTNTRTLFFS